MFKRYQIFYNILFLFLTIITIQSLQAKELTTKELSTMTFTDLLNVNVKIASKTDEVLLKASGTVYVLNDEDFENYGCRTVADALRLIPGIDISMNYRYLDGGHRGFGSDFSETVLLLDGREIQKLRNGRASQPLISYPLHNVSRIEVLQGPASTLYGSHALQGVINIITKASQAKDMQESTSSSIIYGDGGTQQYAIETIRHNGDLSIGISAHNFYSDRDWDKLGEFFSNPNNIRQDSADFVHNTISDDYNNREQDNSLVIHAEYKKFYAGVSYFENDNLHSSGSNDFPGAIRAGIKERIIYAGYNFQHNKNIESELEIEYLFQRDEYKEIFFNSDSLGIQDFDDIDRFDSYLFSESQRWDSKVLKFKGKLDAHFSKSNNILVGFDVWRGDYFAANAPNTFYALNSDELNWPNTQSNKYSIFIQNQMMLLNEKLKVVSGVRFNKEDFVENSLTPRISVIIEPKNQTVFKATYSEGFRALAFAQFGQAVGSVDPTEMKMFEFNYSQSYKRDGLQLLNSLSWYTMEQVGILERVPTNNLIGVSWTNTGEKRKINGIENFLRLQYNKSSGFVSFYWIAPEEKSISENGIEYIENIPKYKFKVGFSTDLSTHLRIGTFMDHWGKTEWEVDNYNEVTRELLPGQSLHTQDAFTDINLYLHFRNLKLKDAGNASFDITLAIDNVTDEQYAHHIRPWIAMGYRQPPRRFWVKVDLNL